MRVLIGADHRGFELKEEIKKILQDFGIFVIDVGVYDHRERVDFPKYASAVCERFLKGEGEYGILICQSGIGMSIAANKYKDIRAGLCIDAEHVKLAKQHNDINILCLSTIFLKREELKDMIYNFLFEKPLQGVYKERRKQIEGIEKEKFVYNNYL